MDPKVLHVLADVQQLDSLHLNVFTMFIVEHVQYLANSRLRYRIAYLSLHVKYATHLDLESVNGLKGIHFLKN